MTRLTRRLIAAAFILVFLGLGPLAVIYSKGFRFKSTEQDLNRTGTLIISSKPSKATIYLNNELLDSVTPLTLTALPPQRYTIQLQAPGYHTWGKTLSVNEGQATFLSDVRLLKNSLPISQTTNTRILNPDPSRTYQLTATATTAGQEQLGLLNLTTQEWQILKQIPPLTILPASNHPLVAWSNNQASLSIIIDQNIYFVRLENSNISMSTLPIKTTAVIFEPGSDSSVVITNGQLVYRLTPTGRWENMTYKPLASGAKILQLWAVGNNRWEMTQLTPTGPNSIAVRDLDNNLLYNLALPSPEKYHFLGVWDEIAILQTDKDRLFIARLQSGSLIELLTVPDVTSVSLDEPTSTITYATQFEIWTYEPANDKRELLTRLGAPLQQVDLLADGNHIIYVTGNELWAIERDGRDVRNSWLLASFKQLDNFLSSSDSALIYVTGTIGQIEGLFNLEL
jgi:hypothetical protein